MIPIKDSLEQLSRAIDKLSIETDAMDAWYQAESVYCLLLNMEDQLKDFQAECCKIFEAPLLPQKFINPIK